jgi:Flp pilus assembly protein TadG
MKRIKFPARPNRRPSIDRLKECVFDSSGQALLEATIVMPLLIVLVFAVIELGTALRNDYAVVRLAREGSNLISRNTTLQDATNALTTMSSASVDFSSNSTVIFSVLKRGSTTGSANYNHIVLYKRYTYGSYSATSRLTTAGSGSFGPAPDYIAYNSDTDTSLQVTNLPAGLASSLGGMSYVTEIFSTNPLQTPLATFGLTMPTQLYSVAYF